MARERGSGSSELPCSFGAPAYGAFSPRHRPALTPPVGETAPLELALGWQRICAETIAPSSSAPHRRGD